MGKILLRILLFLLSLLEYSGGSSGELVSIGGDGVEILVETSSRGGVGTLPR